MLASSGLVISIKPKANNENIRMAAIFLVYIPQKYYQKKKKVRFLLMFVSTRQLKPGRKIS